MIEDPHELDDRPGDPVVVERWLGAPALSYARRPGTVPDALARAVRRWPGAVAFIDGDRQVTYAELAGLVESAAAALLGRGLRPGDAVAVASGNSLELAVLLLACARARLVMVGLNARLSPPQWDYMADHMRARLRLVAAGLPFAGAEPLVDLLAEKGAPLRQAGPTEDETYAVVFTSGTTGRPKASQVVHRCSVHSAMSYQRVLQLQPAERTAVLFPLTYISAMHAHVLPALLSGATCVLTDSPSPRSYVELLRRLAVSWAYAVPSWWQLCLRVADFGDLPALSRLAAGGAPFPADLQATLRSRLPEVRLHDVYGLSETHSPACIATDADLAAHPGSVGRPLPCMQAQVRGEDGAVLGPGVAGELWLRGSLVTSGYAHEPGATRAAIVDGWFDTGDIARIDGDGFVSVVDRSKDMINHGGTKVFPAEVEQILRLHPAVEDAAVIGVPDPLAGEAVAAYIVAGAPLQPADVRAWVRERLAAHAAPRLVVFVDDLPRNALGKTDKRTLRERG